MTTDIKRPVLRYHGGKFMLAKWIISHFPEHRIYVEGFGGGGSVLMRKPRSYAEVYNDRWDTVVNVFQIMRDPDLAKELQRQLELTPFSRTEFENTGDEQLNLVNCPIEKARRTILRSFAGFGSAATNAKYATGFRASSNRSGTTPAHDWANYPKHIDSFINRLRGVVIENRDYKTVHAQHDSSETLHFMDPPYVHSTRNMRRGNAAYACEMTDKQHIELIEFAHSLKGTVVLCGYANFLYDMRLLTWARHTMDTFADGARERKEVLWIKPAQK